MLRLLSRLLLRWLWWLLHAVTELRRMVYLRWRCVCIWVRSLHVRRRVVRRLLLCWRWWNVLLRWWCGSRSLPRSGRHVRIADTCLALLRRPCGGATRGLQLLGLGYRLLILRWCRRWGLHRRGRLCLLYLPCLNRRLLLLVLLTIDICHRVHSNISMRIKGDSHAVWCRCPILTLPCALVKAANATTTNWPGWNGRGRTGSGMVDRWATRTAVGTDARVAFPANWTLKEIPLILTLTLWWCNSRLLSIEARATTVGAAAMFTREALVVRINDSINNGGRSL